MVWIQRLDVRAGVRSPVRDDRCFTSAATGLVTELPGKNGRAGLVAVDDKLDVGFVSCLRFRVGIEGRCRATESGYICVYAAKIVPIVEKWENE